MALIAPSHFKLHCLWLEETSAFVSCEDQPESIIGPLEQHLQSGNFVFTTFQWPLVPVIENTFEPEILFRWHWERLTQNAGEFGILTSEEVATLQGQALVVFNAISKALRRLQTSPEPTGLRLLWFPPAEEPSSSLALGLKPASPWCPTKPLRLKTVFYEKPNPHIKHGGLIEAFQLREQVQDQGFDDALWMNVNHHITETTTANIIFKMKDGQYLTPPVCPFGCLPGTTRRQIITWAQQEGQPIRESPIHLPDFSQVSAAWIINAGIGIQPVGQIDDQSLKVFEFVQHFNSSI